MTANPHSFRKSTTTASAYAVTRVEDGAPLGDVVRVSPEHVKTHPKWNATSPAGDYLGAHYASRDAAAHALAIRAAETSPARLVPVSRPDDVADLAILQSFAGGALNPGRAYPGRDSVDGWDPLSMEGPHRSTWHLTGYRLAGQVGARAVYVLRFAVDGRSTFAAAEVSTSTDPAHMVTVHARDYQPAEERTRTGAEQKAAERLAELAATEDAAPGSWQEAAAAGRAADAAHMAADAETAAEQLAAVEAATVAAALDRMTGGTVHRITATGPACGAVGTFAEWLAVTGNPADVTCEPCRAVVPGTWPERFAAFEQRHGLTDTTEPATDRPAPVDLPCEGCTAEPGEPCRPGCVGYAAHLDDVAELDDLHNGETEHGAPLAPPSYDAARAELADLAREVLTGAGEWSPAGQLAAAVLDVERQQQPPAVSPTGALHVSAEVAGALAAIRETLDEDQEDGPNVEEARALLALLAAGMWGAGTRDPEDETTGPDGRELPRGRCDSCGAPCAGDTGQCTRDRAHLVAVE